MQLMTKTPAALSQTDPAKTLFGFQFVTLSRRWRKVIHAELAKAGLTDATWAPLVHLDAGDGISQTELADQLALDTSSLVRLLDILSERGLIERRVDPKDRRARLLYLTPEGHADVARIKTHLNAVEATLLTDLSDTEVAALIRAMDKINITVERALTQTTKADT